MTQYTAIINTMRLTGITAAEWCKHTGSTKLTSRISELRDRGFKFIVTKERKKRGGTFNRYFLKK